MERSRSEVQRLFISGKYPSISEKLSQAREPRRKKSSEREFYFSPSHHSSAVSAAIGRGHNRHSFAKHMTDHDLDRPDPNLPI